MCTCMHAFTFVRADAHEQMCVCKHATTQNSILMRSGRMAIDTMSFPPRDVPEGPQRCKQASWHCCIPADASILQLGRGLHFGISCHRSRPNPASLRSCWPRCPPCPWLVAGAATSRARSLPVGAPGQTVVPVGRAMSHATIALHAPGPGDRLLLAVPPAWYPQLPNLSFSERPKAVMSCPAS